MPLICKYLIYWFFGAGVYRDKSRIASKMRTWEGYTHAGVVPLSVWFCREKIFEALQRWNGRAPSDGLLLGFCIVLMAWLVSLLWLSTSLMSCERGEATVNTPSRHRYDAK